MPTIKEVSRRAKVSPSTVSRVLNETVPVAADTRQRVLDAVKELDYQPNVFARGLVTNRSGGIGVVLNEISSPYYAGLIGGIEKVVEAEGGHLLVSSGHADAEKEREAVAFLRQRRSDAVIVQVDAATDYDLLAWAKSGPPLIIFGRNVAELTGSCVYLDNEQGGFLATQHLIDNGHRRIAHITGPLWVQDSRARLQGYRRALSANRLPFDELLVVEGDFAEAGGQLAMTLLLERRVNVSAVFVGNDQMALGALTALREAGCRVPNDISLVGYDDVLFARYLSPSLTTIRQPLFEMGQAAARLAVARLKGTETEVKRSFEPELIVRTSVQDLR
ncbi:substrate-binding domain-containing protein [soil metagenome]